MEHRFLEVLILRHKFESCFTVRLPSASIYGHVSGLLCAFKNTSFGLRGPIDWPKRSPEFTLVDILSEIIFEGDWYIGRFLC